MIKWDPFSFCQAANGRHRDQPSPIWQGCSILLGIWHWFIVENEILTFWCERTFMHLYLCIYAVYINNLLFCYPLLLFLKVRGLFLHSLLIFSFDEAWSQELIWFFDSFSSHSFKAALHWNFLFLFHRFLELVQHVLIKYLFYLIYCIFFCF